jgi:Membrane domain of glycerophosphoryl diester phosphodiesterase
MSDPTPDWVSPGGWAPAGPPSAPASPEPDGRPQGGQSPAAQPYGSQQHAGQQYAGQFATPPGWGGPRPERGPGVVPLRPLGLGELLDGAVAVVRRHPRPVLGLSALVAVVSTLLNIVAVSTLSFGSGLGDSDVSGAETAAQLLAYAGSSVVGFLSRTVMSGLVTVVVGQAVLGRSVTAGQAWRGVRPRLLRLVGLALLVGLLLAVTFVLPIAVAAGLVLGVGTWTLWLGIPLGVAGGIATVWLYVRWALAGPALVLERQGVRAAMRRSAVLVKGSFWRVLGILLLSQLIAGAIGAVLQIPFFIVGAATSGLFSGGGEDVPLGFLVLGQVGSGLTQLVLGPFLAGVVALLYVDRRMRAEGLDVSLAAAAATPDGTLPT